MTLIKFKQFRYFFCALVFISFLNNNAWAKSKKSNDFASRTSDIGISGGMWFAGDVNLGDFGVDITKESNFMFRVIADTYLMPKFAVGAYFNYAPLTFEDVDADATMIEYGVTLKPRFLLKPTLAVKPGLNIGYRQISTDYEYTDSEGLGVNLSIEFQFLVNDLIFYIEPGFLSQPTGGNDITEVSWAPIWYVLAGIAF